MKTREHIDSLMSELHDEINEARANAKERAVAVLVRSFGRGVKSQADLIADTIGPFVLDSLSKDEERDLVRGMDMAYESAQLISDLADRMGASIVAAERTIEATIARLDTEIRSMTVEEFDI